MEKKILMVSLVGSAIAWGSLVVSASAQESCTCLVDKANVTGAIGSITTVQGVVQASGTDGLISVSTGYSLFPGAQVITGANASAMLDFSPNECGQMSMPGMSEVVIFETDVGYCVNRTETLAQTEVTYGQSAAPEIATAPAPELTPFQQFLSGPGPLVGVGVAAGGVFAATQLGGGDDDASD